MSFIWKKEEVYTRGNILLGVVLLILCWLSNLYLPNTTGRDGSSNDGTWTGEKYFIFLFDWEGGRI